MAKPGAPEIDKNELKKLLIRSKKEPVNCAVGQAADGSAVIMLDKIKQPRAVFKKMEEEYGDIKNGRWGTAEVDVDADPKLVILTINKAASGLARKLKKTLKGTTFTKVRVMLEGGGVDEEEMEDDEDEDEDPGQVRSPEVLADEPPPATGQPAADKQEEPAPAAAADPAAPAAAPPAAPAGVDFKALAGQLTALVKKMIPIKGSDADRFAQLKAIADKAQAAIKASGDEAVELVYELDAAIEGGAGAATPAGAPAAPAAPAAAAGAAADPAGVALDPAKRAALEASPKLWTDTITSIEGSINKLKDAIRKDFASESPEVVGDIEKNLDRISRITDRFDTTLSNLLKAAHDATDEATHRASITKAKAVLADHIKYISSEPLIDMLDQNPFGVTTDIKKNMIDSLKQLREVVR